MTHNPKTLRDLKRQTQMPESFLYSDYCVFRLMYLITCSIWELQWKYNRTTTEIFQASLYVQNCLELSSRRSGSTWLQTGSTIYADLRTLLRWSNERRHGLRMLWCYVYSANSKAGEGKIILKSMLVKRGLRVLIVFNVLGLCPLAFTWFRCCENPCASHSERIVWQRGWVEVSPFTGRILSLNYTTVVTAELDGPAWRKRKQLIEVHTTRKKWMMKDVKWYGGSVSILWGESAGAWGLSIISVYVWG